MAETILDKLEKLIDESVKKRETFLLAVTKSSKSISKGASDWFESEADLLEKEMDILKDIMSEDVQEWRKRLDVVSAKFKRAISFLNDVIAKAEKGELTSIREVQPPPSSITPLPEGELPIIEIVEEVEEEKKLDLVSAILEVFDAASSLEKLIKEVEKESRRTVSTARLVIRIMKK